MADNNPSEKTFSRQLYSNGQISVPAELQFDHVGSCYNQEVAVEVETPNSPATSIEFTAFVTASSTITVPANLRRQFNIVPGEEVSFTMEPTGNTWAPDDGGRENYGSSTTDFNRGSSQSEVKDSVEETEKDDPALGELFQ